jgi:hypothetical protein
LSQHASTRAQCNLTDVCAFYFSEEEQTPSGIGGIGGGAAAGLFGGAGAGQLFGGAGGGGGTLFVFAIS